MPEKVPFFKCYPSDFMGGIRGLSAQEVGVYTMLLMRMYEESGPLEDNLDILSVYCGMRKATFSKVLDRLVLLKKFSRENGVIKNDRAETEISSRANDLKNKSKAGKVSAQKRQQKQGEASTDVQQNPNYTDTDTDTDTDTELIKKNNKKKVATRLPEGWVLPDDYRTYAQDRGFTPHEIKNMTEDIRDWSLSSPSGAKLNWKAAWQGWVRRELEKKPNAKNGNPYSQRPSANARSQREKLEAIAAGVRRSEENEGSDRRLLG